MRISIFVLALREEGLDRSVENIENKMSEQFPILYHDDAVIAIYKPPGILVHRTALSTDRETVLQLLRAQIGQKLYPVHRLDRPTSGILLLALTSEAARHLSLQFRNRTIQKTYNAVVRGWLENSIIDKPLLNERGDEYMDAVTEFTSLEQFEIPVAMGLHETTRYSLVECKPKTGRMHQIRRHLKSDFHPIVGDTNYGDGKHNTLFRERFNCSRLLLNATSITFKHPLSEEVITIDLPAELALETLFLKS